MENTFPSDDDALVLLPEDVLIRILVWLPIKSLLRFKSVCKSWRALIETSFFIHLHATVTATTTSSSKFDTLIFQTSPPSYHSSYYNTPMETKIFMLTSTKSGNGNGGGEVFEVEDLGFPPLYKVAMCTHQVAMVGSCNGLICLHNDSKLDFSLWNPATRQFRLLPKSLAFEEHEEQKMGIHVQNVFGFGFDVKTKDYKVVRITQRRLKVAVNYNMFLVQVYSLSTDSWRVLEGGEGINSLFPKPVEGLSMNTHGLYLNGSYFFKGIYFVEHRIRQWVLSFDFTKEIFTPVPFPNELDPNSKLILTYFGGDKIALFTGLVEKESSDQSNCLYDIWVLNEHHWTKLQHSIQLSKRKELGIWDISWISNDGEFALIETRGGNGNWDWKLQLFNLVTKEEKTVYPTGIDLQRTDVYKPSLVSIIGGGNDNDTAAAAEADWGDWWGNVNIGMIEHVVKPYCY